MFCVSAVNGFKASTQACGPQQQFVSALSLLPDLVETGAKGKPGTPTFRQAARRIKKAPHWTVGPENNGRVRCDDE
jgi:hypothetical protein